MSFDSVLDKFYPIMIILTVILVVLLWQGFATYRARANILREEAYRKLSEQATVAEQKSADAQQKTLETLDDMRVRLASIEKILRDVE